MGWNDPRNRLTPSRLMPRTPLTHEEQAKPSVLYENRRVTRTIRMNGSMSWMETMNLHSVPGLLLTLKLGFTLLTLVELTESSLCFTHKDNTQAKYSEISHSQISGEHATLELILWAL
ncbi:uncharacterized protein LOC130821812 isoform X1 [Amaranthus tricolor]|uniref:uncharacterized protein LOC130821812 isoform X1 n=1 Tax=Amaranthus tricolor TaxID=29722 RepID=UPI00258A99CF|nr:uncharacterized protein LOC130821812 isoform X1 [Amaranthus tricolor]